jgi:hypothetical protein
MSDDITPPEDICPSDVNWARLRERHCRHLRSKEMFYDNGIPLEDRGSSGVFWCGETFKCFGPDNANVSMEECGPHRVCYQL